MFPNLIICLNVVLLCVLFSFQTLAEEWLHYIKTSAGCSAFIFNDAAQPVFYCEISNNKTFFISYDKNNREANLDLQTEDKRVIRRVDLGKLTDSGPGFYFDVFFLPAPKLNWKYTTFGHCVILNEIPNVGKGEISSKFHDKLMSKLAHVRKEENGNVFIFGEIGSHLEVIKKNLLDEKDVNIVTKNIENMIAHNQIKIVPQ